MALYAYNEYEHHHQQPNQKKLQQQQSNLSATWKGPCGTLIIYYLMVRGRYNEAPNFCLLSPRLHTMEIHSNRHRSSSFFCLGRTTANKSAVLM